MYFIQAGESGPVKIGISDNVDKRISGLQCSNPEQLYLRALIEGGTPELEVELNARFKNSRIRGEWFYPTKDLIDFMVKHY